MDGKREFNPRGGSPELSCELTSSFMRVTRKICPNSVSYCSAANRLTNLYAYYVNSYRKLLGRLIKNHNPRVPHKLSPDVTASPSQWRSVGISRLGRMPICPLNLNVPPPYRLHQCSDVVILMVHSFVPLQAENKLVRLGMYFFFGWKFLKKSIIS